MSLAEQKMEREALLATSLSHPNVIATFKICTMMAGAALSSKNSAVDIANAARALRRSQLAAGPEAAGPSSTSSRDPAEYRQNSAEPRPHAAGRGSMDSAGRGDPLAGSGGRGSGGRGRGVGGVIGSGGATEEKVTGDSDSRSSGGQRQAASVGTAGSADSFDGATAVVVDLPAPDVSHPVGTKGSDSAQNNGGLRPGRSPAAGSCNLELTDGEKEAEDDEAAIEERCAVCLLCSLSCHSSSPAAQSWNPAKLSWLSFLPILSPAMLVIVLSST